MSEGGISRQQRKRWIVQHIIWQLYGHIEKIVEQNPYKVEIEM